MPYPRICHELRIYPYIYISACTSINPTEMKCYMECVASSTQSTRRNHIDNCVWRIWIWRRASGIINIIDVDSACAAERGTRASTAVTIYCICSEEAIVTIMCIMLTYLFIINVCVCIFVCNLCDKQLLFLCSINIYKCSGRDKPYPDRRE